MSLLQSQIAEVIYWSRREVKGYPHPNAVADRILAIPVTIIAGGRDYDVFVVRDGVDELVTLGSNLPVDIEAAVLDLKWRGTHGPSTAGDIITAYGIGATVEARVRAKAKA